MYLIDFFCTVPVSLRRSAVVVCELPTRLPSEAGKGFLIFEWISSLSRSSQSFTKYTNLSHAYNIHMTKREGVAINPNSPFVEVVIMFSHTTDSFRPKIFHGASSARSQQKFTDSIA
jgi:hypothetical protein